MIIFMRGASSFLSDFDEIDAIWSGDRLVCQPQRIAQFRRGFFRCRPTNCPTSNSFGAYCKENSTDLEREFIKVWRY
ncbi:MAG: hypothetical protein IPL33_06460 [Sphingobacteriales bacterium]|nr:hypothetical protein [Sphingobacteriales bacterium]